MIPNKLYHQTDLDDSVLEALAARGDDAAREHDVEHHFYAETADPLRELAALGAKLGFGPGAMKEAEHEGGRYYHFDLVSHTRLTASSVYRESLLMRLLSESYRVGYDGWGTLIAK